MFKKHKDNLKYLQDIASKIGEAYQNNSYKELKEGTADIQKGLFEYNGENFQYHAYSFVVRKTGDVGFCITLDTDRPTLFGKQPSSTFFMRPDGTVYT